MIFHSFQHFPHLSCKFEYFWKKNWIFFIWLVLQSELSRNLKEKNSLGLRPPTGAAPLDPACFWIEDSSGNRFVLNGISAKNLNIFFIEIFFFLTQHFFFSKSSELYPGASFQFFLGGAIAPLPSRFWNTKKNRGKKKLTPILMHFFIRFWTF